MYPSLYRYYREFGLAGLVAGVKTKVTRKTITFSFKHRDCKYPLWLRTFSSDLGVYRQIFKRQEYKFQTNKTPEIIIDAGANIGYASVYFANQFPQAKIFSLEPEEENFKLLQKNTSCYSNIVPIKAALWHKNEEINLTDPMRGEWGYTVEDRAQTATNQHLSIVSGVTIDKLMQDYNLPSIDILKIDIEGTEKEIFSCKNLLWLTKTDSLIIELHDRLKPGCSNSFFQNKSITEFPPHWQQGENVYLSRSCIMSLHRQ